MKRAKEEAQAEIRNYREEREKQFVDYQREVSLMHGVCMCAKNLSSSYVIDCGRENVTKNNMDVH